MAFWFVDVVSVDSVFVYPVPSWSLGCHSCLRLHELPSSSDVILIADLNSGRLSHPVPVPGVRAMMAVAYFHLTCKDTI